MRGASMTKRLIPGAQKLCVDDFEHKLPQFEQSRDLPLQSILFGGSAQAVIPITKRCADEFRRYLG